MGKIALNARTARYAIAVLGVALVVSQFVPLSRTNPPVTREVRWDSPQTRVLAQRACFDCHSNVTTWPWYSHVTPVSFLVVSDVDDGRRRLNFSEWDKPQRATIADVQQDIENGDMPAWQYLPMHRDAWLSCAEKSLLSEGLRRTFAADPPVPGPPLRRR